MSLPTRNWKKSGFLSPKMSSCGGYGLRLANAQGRPLDWPSYGGNAQRTGWEKSDSRITKDNVKEFQLVLKSKLDNQETGPHALTPPAIIGLLISYRGFKESFADEYHAIDRECEALTQNERHIGIFERV